MTSLDHLTTVTVTHFQNSFHEEWICDTMQQIAWHQPTCNRNEHRVKKVRASTGRAGMQTKLASMNISASSWSVMEWIESIIFRFGKCSWRGGTYHHYWLRILQNLVSNGCCYATSDFFLFNFLFFIRNIFVSLIFIKFLGYLYVCCFLLLFCFLYVLRVYLWLLFLFSLFFFSFFECDLFLLFRSK